MTIRVVLADDQALLRKGFRMILEAEDDISVIGEAPDGEAALRLVELYEPDVVLMDVRMPALDGIGATLAITASGSLSHDVSSPGAAWARIAVRSGPGLSKLMRRSVPSLSAA